MKKVKIFAVNVLLLTVTALIMRSASLYFNVYLKNKLGVEGIGLFTLTLSVYGFAITFATSGINLAATRLCSEAIGRGRPSDMRKIMKKCVSYCLFFGLTAGAVMFFFAPFIGKKLLGDSRCVLSLRVLALALPCISLSSAFSGYFTAVRRVSKSAAAQIAEQALKIGGTIALLTYFMPSSLEYMCLAVVAGGVAADILSFLCSAALFLNDIKRGSSKSIHRCDGIGKKLASIALPVAASSYVRSALVTTEHLLIPRGLRKHGHTADSALASYGVIQAMTFPIIMFPYAFLAPFCALLVPEAAELNAAGDNDGVRRICNTSLKFVLAFGIGTAGIMICFSGEMGRIFYNSTEASSYIKMLAPLIPVMYLDTATDSLLKGLNEQIYSMRVNIVDSVLSVIFVFFLVPRFGILGYVVNIIICELINFSLSIIRLLRVAGIRFMVFSFLVKPLFCVVASTFISRLLSRVLPDIDGGMTLALHLTVSALVYILMLSATGVIKISDISAYINKRKPHTAVSK